MYVLTNANPEIRVLVREIRRAANATFAHLDGAINSKVSYPTRLRRGEFTGLLTGMSLVGVYEFYLGNQLRLRALPIRTRPARKLAC